MQKQISDTQVRATVRNTLTQLRLDVQPLSIASARGVIRVSGELRRSGADAGPLRASTLDDVERELRRLPGVRRVHLEAPNWRRAVNGNWIPIKPVGASR